MSWRKNVCFSSAQEQWLHTLWLCREQKLRPFWACREEPFRSLNFCTNNWIYISTSKNQFLLIYDSISLQYLLFRMHRQPLQSLPIIHPMQLGILRRNISMKAFYITIKQNYFVFPEISLFQIFAHSLSDHYKTKLFFPSNISLSPIHSTQFLNLWESCSLQYMW